MENLPWYNFRFSEMKIASVWGSWQSRYSPETSVDIVLEEIDQSGKITSIGDSIDYFRGAMALGK